MSAGAPTPTHAAWSTTLDVFKGVAALAMVVNHAGFAWLGGNAAHQGWTGLLVFLGSLAPVFFFFATGAGAGLKPPGARTNWRSLAGKAAWLLLADQFLLWSHGQRWGMDFFGFIALSMLVVAAVSAQKSPRVWAAVLMLLLLALRYGNRDAMAALIAEQGLLVWATGVSGLPGWSYPLSPWLVAPLAGFVAARGLPQVAPKMRRAAAVGSLLGGALLSAWMYSRGASFFRWGSVSAGFLVVAFTAVVAAWVASNRFASIFPVMARRLSLRGSAALLVVPIHYAALAVVGELAEPKHWPKNAAIALIVLVAVLCVPVARMLAEIQKQEPLAQRATSRAMLLLAVAAIAWAPLPSVWIVLACCAGQVVIAAQFIRR